MKLTLVSSVLIGFAIIAGIGTREGIRPLDPTAMSRISGKCFSTYPAASCPSINTSCAATTCTGNWLIGYSCPASTEGHSSSSTLIPQCMDTGPDGDTACGTGYSYACGYTLPCGVYCFLASDGFNYCQGPAQVQTPAFFYQGNQSNGISCPIAVPISNLALTQAEPTSVPEALRLVASLNGYDYNPFR